MGHCGRKETRTKSALLACPCSHGRHVSPHVNPPHRSGSESGQRWLHSSSSSKTNPTDRVRPTRKARRKNPGRKRCCCRRVSSSCFSPRWRLCSSAVHLLRHTHLSHMGSHSSPLLPGIQPVHCQGRRPKQKVNRRG